MSSTPPPGVTSTTMDTVNETFKSTLKFANESYKSISTSILTKIGKDQVSSVATTPSPVVATTSSPVRRGLTLVSHAFGSASPWIRIAGISGAMAVSMGAYGAHGLKDVPDDQRAVFETANRYHFIHTLALLAVPMTNRPNVVGTLFVVGTLLFSGTCYCHGVSGNNQVIQLTPYGGMALILAWLAMIL